MYPNIFPAAPFLVADSAVAVTVLRPVNSTPGLSSATAGGPTSAPAHSEASRPPPPMGASNPIRDDLRRPHLTGPLCLGHCHSPSPSVFPALIRRLVSGQSSVRHSLTCSLVLHFVS
ncbi:hypothetical protein NDU88_007491 [Pleurodeles waltl]|uniref:Uncharacterized protein n=1 Tax=Pleurodeles waltl TaxID=8319 RepID=A0AAV7VSR2_PLEWA|nr:hypothetical protein NDU88_007491 [Pleurodeles waltl]